MITFAKQRIRLAAAVIAVVTSLAAFAMADAAIPVPEPFESEQCGGSFAITAAVVSGSPGIPYLPPQVQPNPNGNCPDGFTEVGMTYVCLKDPEGNVIACSFQSICILEEVVEFD